MTRYELEIPYLLPDYRRMLAGTVEKPSWEASHEPIVFSFFHSCIALPSDGVAIGGAEVRIIGAGFDRIWVDWLRINGFRSDRANSTCRHSSRRTLATAWYSES